MIFKREWFIVACVAFGIVTVALLVAIAWAPKHTSILAGFAASAMVLTVMSGIGYFVFQPAAGRIMDAESQ
jgi:hypothetical protein